eukprot:TRINITY_DN12406_c0_g1_i1.p1 TRINITY_DN12406_c0_g1~~TRINITY_DN12406_c0_g1_i1.p1  ORF type:complete len:260 (+),score=85.68 TRINITY_DN12406_c0_g1_i1:127-906(+)
MGKRGRNPPEPDASGEAITKDGEMPQKRFYRSRAHVNPLSHNSAYRYPRCPEEAPWAQLYPGVENPVVRVVDIGCGFGGLTVALAKLLPDKCVLAMEIRDKVAEFVRLRIEALRREQPGAYANAAVLRANAMVNLPNYLARGQLDKAFFAFPDPHFKAKNHRRRIVSDALLSEYAFFLRPGGLLYTITDVEALHAWHVARCGAHAAFEALSAEEAEADPCVAAMREETEEGKKVARAGGAKYWAVFRRKEDADVSYSIF